MNPHLQTPPGKLLSRLLVVASLGCSVLGCGGAVGDVASGTSAAEVLAGSWSAGRCKDDPAHTYVVRPAADATEALERALAEASAHPVTGNVGPSGQPQGRVYLQAGDYGLKEVAVPSNVRVELEPGASLHPLPKTDNLFTFGFQSGPVSNVSFVAGDGHCGPGRPTPVGTANKPANTKFRGNQPGLGNAHTYGMANEAVPSTPDWAVQKMWVIDLDPKLSGAPVTAHAFFFAWAYDVLVENVFSIQNPTVTPAGAAIEGVTSHQAVMVFHPSKGAPYIADREKTQMAHRIHISWHYNILSPAGFGPNQITACLDCTFDHLYSHGGTALRLETDAIKPLCGYDHCGACNGVVPGPKGVGFDSYGLVDGLSATHLRGEDGNRVVSLSPHCLPNGVVHLDDVRGKSMVDVIRMTDHTGYFSSESTLSNVAGVGGDVAEVPVPKMLGFQLTPSRDAFYNDAAHYTLRLSGTFCWPGSLANGRVPKGGTLLSPPHCDDGMGLLP